MPIPLRITLATCTLLLPACNGSSPVESEYASENDIVITREGGGAISFSPTIRAECGPWEEGEIPEPAVHVVVGSASSRWELRVVRRDIVIGEPLTFPNTYIFDDPDGADIFVHDPPNELSTQEDESSGAIVIESLDCDASGGIRFAVDGIIGSELGDLSPVSITGEFSSPWTN